MYVEFLFELREQLGASLLGALGRRLDLLEKAGDLLVILLQELKSVHVCPPPVLSSGGP